MEQCVLMSFLGRLFGRHPRGNVRRIRRAIHRVVDGLVVLDAGLPISGD
jgi:hypothetical protein